MNPANFMFYFFEVMAAASALCILFIRNVFYGALLLMVCLLSISGIYVLSFAEFVAVTQILVYVGGILVVIIFGIMLTTKLSGKPLQVHSNNWLAAVIAGSFFFGLLSNLFNVLSRTITQPAQHMSNKNTIQVIGRLLLNDFVLPFEIAGILLLMALIGAAVTASTIKEKK